MWTSPFDHDSAATFFPARAASRRGRIVRTAVALLLLATGTTFAWSGDGITDIEKLKPADFEMTPPADRMGRSAETAAAVAVKRLGLDYVVGEPFLIRDRDFKPVRWSVPVTSRADTTKPPKATSLEYETKFLKDKSWWFEKEKFSETSKIDMQLLQHEKGHVWIREISTIMFNSIRQQVLDKINKEIPESVLIEESVLNLDSTPEDIAKAKALAKAMAKAIFVDNRTKEALQIGDTLAQTAESDRKLNKDYDKETISGTDTAEQLRWKAKILDMLTPKKKDETKEAKSAARDSLHFDPANGQLLFTSDLIQSIPGLAFDTLVGATVNFPVFHYEGQDSFHVPFFVALGDDRITIEKVGDVCFAGQLPYLFYTAGQ